MPFAERRLTNPTTLSTVASTVYTVPSQYTTIVKQVVVTNTTASPASFNLYIGSATSANAIFSNTTISANDSLIINLSQVLSSLEILTASANANSAVNMTISGVENNGPLDPANVYIADGAITTSKIANSAITTDKIAANAVVTADIANNAVTQAKLDTTVRLSGMRNAIINGDFNINQRGLTSVGTTTQLYSGYDRWLWVATGGTVTYSAQVFTPGNAISGYEPKSFARLAISGQSASGDFCLFGQKIEDVRIFAGQQVTLSFWAKSATGTPSISVELDQSFGAGGSSSVQSYITKIPITTSWARYTATFTVPSISTKTVGSGTDSYLGLNFWYSSGTGTSARTGSLGIQNNTFDIWGVQLEQSSQATPFEQRPIGVELQLCQRYYYAPQNAGGAGGDGAVIGGMGYNYSTTAAIVFVTLPVLMRTQPTIAAQSTLEWATVDGSATGPSVGIFTSLSGNHYIALDLTGMTGRTTQMAGWLRFATATTGSFAVQAEL